jgi:hypothetical protein
VASSGKEKGMMLLSLNLFLIYYSLTFGAKVNTENP